MHAPDSAIAIRAGPGRAAVALYYTSSAGGPPKNRVRFWLWAETAALTATQFSTGMW